MAELSTLARPYAKAAYGFAAESGQTTQWEEYLAFSASLMNDADFAAYLAQPNMTQADQLTAMVNVSNDSFPAEYTNFLTQLTEHNRLEILPAVFAEYQRIKATADQETRAQVESAFELSADETAALQAALQKRFGTSVSMDTTVNPDLIAGVIIRVGDQVIDDSALGKLKRLKTKLS